MIGWKVMRASTDGQVLISGADGRLRFPAHASTWIDMPGQGIWMSLSPAHVLDHYAVHDYNALVALSFDPASVLQGRLDDAEPEFTVRHARVEGLVLFDCEADPATIMPPALTGCDADSASVSADLPPREA